MIDGAVDLAESGLDRAVGGGVRRRRRGGGEGGEWPEQPSAELDQDDAELQAAFGESVATGAADPLDEAVGAELAEVVAELAEAVVGLGQAVAVAQPIQVGKRRVPGLRLQDDRVLRLLDVLLHPGGFVADWTSRDALARLLDRHRLAEADYRLSQLRYDLGKLRAYGFVERIGRTRRYRLTARGLKFGILLVKLRTRLLGPLATLATAPTPPPDTTTDSAVEAAFRQVDHTIDHLCITLGLKPAA